MSANSRAGHKFNLDQVVDYGPKGASKFSKAWANAVAFAEWAEARQHEEAIAARCSHKQRRGGFGRPFFLALDGSAQFRCNHRRDSKSFMISRIPKPITSKPKCKTRKYHNRDFELTGPLTIPGYADRDVGN